MGHNGENANEINRRKGEWWVIRASHNGGKVFIIKGAWPKCAAKCAKQKQKVTEWVSHG